MSQAQRLLESDEDSLVVFCIDISGSMASTTTIPRGHELVKIKGVTGEYISRIQCMKAAIDMQIEEIYKSHPGKRVVLIAFNGSVTLIGDGTWAEPVEVPSSKIHNFGELIAEGVGVKLDTLKPIRESKTALSAKLFALEEDGPTALGPALCLAAGIASQKSGSEIIICTDGVPNEGIGGEDDPKREEFYQQVGTFAKNSGTTISIIGIEGSDCGVTSLAVCADISAGTNTTLWRLY
jgi:hypothetical protein